MQTSTPSGTPPQSLFDILFRLGALLVALLLLSPSAWAGTITVTYPNGGETLLIGDAAQVTWSAIDVSGDVEIEYTVDGSRWRGIDKAPATAGSVSWKIPNKESRIARVRVTSKDGSISDESNGTFEIAPNPLDATIMIAPNGGESWTEGETHTISWQAPLDAVDVLLELSTDNGITWSDVATRPAKPARLDWTVPHVADVPVTTCIVKISVAEAPDHFDASDAPFTIVPKAKDPQPPADAVLTIVTPNGGERFVADTTIRIEWTSNNMTGEISAEYSTNGGTDWSGIGKADVAVGAMLWNVPNKTESTVLIRLLGSDKKVGDTTDGTFEIYIVTVPQPDKVTTVMTPNGGETWTEGETGSITWGAPDGTKQVTIYLSTDDGITWTSLGTVPATPAEYVWTIPHLSDSIITTALVKVSVADKPDISDISNDAFTVVPKKTTPSLAAPSTATTDASIQGAFPNPCSETTELRWLQQTTDEIVIEVFGNDGKVVRTLQPGRREQGEQRAALTVDNLPNGAYIYRIRGTRTFRTGMVIVHR